MALTIAEFTLLVLTVMPTAAMQARRRASNPSVRRILIGSITAFTVPMILCRLFSGVHWLTDIIGGILLSASLVRLYAFSLSAFANPAR